MQGAIGVKGCLTAIITPFNSVGLLDRAGLEKNIEFQISQGIQGLVPAGTTGESPTLTPQEHGRLIGEVSRLNKKRVYILAGCGSNSTEEAVYYISAARVYECPGVLLVDNYCNGPSSFEMAENYYGFIARTFPDITMVPYIIPGRTGTELLAADLAHIVQRFPNIRAVKEATGDISKIRERMSLVREHTPSEFVIFSGDDDLTFAMMADPVIMANGVISVVSNICPRAVQGMCSAIRAGQMAAAESCKKSLEPLLKLVTVKAERTVTLNSKTYTVTDKFRNPDAIKTIMAGLGMPSGCCRIPLGKMTARGVSQVRAALMQVWTESPSLLKPIEGFYGVDIAERLADDSIWDALAFQG